MDVTVLQQNFITRIDSGPELGSLKWSANSYPKERDGVRLGR